MNDGGDNRGVITYRFSNGPNSAGIDAVDIFERQDTAQEGRNHDEDARAE